MSDLPPQPFLMHGARDAMAAGLAHIEAQVRGIEQAVVENPGLAFDLAKTLVESTCRAVLVERSIPHAEGGVICQTCLTQRCKNLRPHHPR